jgi:hypothetical protein
MLLLKGTGRDLVGMISAASNIKIGVCPVLPYLRVARLANIGTEQDKPSQLPLNKLLSVFSTENCL